MRIRAFKPADRSDCLAIFDSNVPDYFDAKERGAFEECLASSDFLPPRLRKGGGPKGRFYAVEQQGVVVGCGGWYLDGPVAILSWGMVRRSLHRREIGGCLLQERLTAIREDGRASCVRVQTTARVQSFFERAGFELTRQGVSGIVDEMPLVELALKLG